MTERGPSLTLRPAARSMTGRAAALLSPESLPRDILENVGARLHLLCRITISVGGFFFLMSHLLLPEPAAGVHLKYILFPLLLVVAGACALWTRWRPLSPVAALRLCNLYQVFGAAVVALLANQARWPVEPTLPSWSPTAVWVLLVPLIVPGPPLRTLLVSLLAAAMDPLAMLVLVRSGWLEAPEPAVAAQRFVPLFAAVWIGTFTARMLMRLRGELSRARRLGSYHLTERLGRGGMGEVWRAEHQHLARPAAVKLIRPGMLGAADEGEAAAVLQRFEREAQTIARLQSPHTVVLYDFGRADDGTFYYVMELLDGLDLGRLVRRHGPLPCERVVHLLRQACHSLEEAHRAGLVHRDIKPANLFVCRYGLEVDFLKVLDFGLVKDRRPHADDPHLSRAGETVGTPAFMAPETVLGGGPPDARADIYALGCVGYWLLTGQEVFPAATSLEAMVLHAKEEPVPPSRRGELPVPAELEAAVMACLAKDPAARPASCAALAALLDTVPCADWSAADAHRWWDLHLPA